MKEGNLWLENEIIDLVTKDGEIPVHNRLESHSGLRSAVQNMAKIGTLKMVHANRDYSYYVLSKSRSKRR